jgi:hypothetical protein
MTSTVLLDELMQTHDADPAFTAQQLRLMAEQVVNEADQPRYTWLVNHVIGETLGLWQDAYHVQQQAIGQSAQRIVLRNRAVAALLAGFPEEVHQWESQLCLVTQASSEHAIMVIRLGVLQHVAPSTSPAVTAHTLAPYLHEMSHWNMSGPLDDLLGASLNNIVFSLLSHEGLDTTDAEQCQTLVEAAQRSKMFWQHAGGWLQHQRADYLRALVFNAIGDWSAAVNAAHSALATIDAYGPEEVDQAFLLLELSCAYRHLGEEQKARNSRDHAFALAKHFDEPRLMECFQKQAAVN